MTEYDYSPAAQQAYQDKLRSIANWNNNVPAHHHLANPFVPSEGKTDFFASQKRSRSKKKGTSRRGRRGRRGYDTGDDDSDDGSDYSGPDRPPTPPASAPVYGGFGPPAAPALYASPYGTAVSPPGYGGYPQPTTAPPSSVYVPMWVGGRMIYQPLQQSQPTSASLVPSPTRPDYESRPRRHRSRSRPRAHRRNSHSVPAFPSPPQSPYNSPSYAYGYATGYLYPSWSQQMMGNGMSTNTSPQSMYSAPLPAAPGGCPGPAPYMTSPPLATAGTGPASGYFGTQPHSAYASPNQVMAPQVVSPGGMSTSPYQVTVQSPNGSASIYSGQSGYVGGYPSVVIVGDAPRKSRRDGGGSSRKSWFGKFTGGM